METIELAVERMRRAKGESGEAHLQLVAPPAPVFQPARVNHSQLRIKTRVLCDYSPEVQAIVAAAPAESPPAQPRAFAGTWTLALVAGITVIAAVLHTDPLGITHRHDAHDARAAQAADAAQPLPAALVVKAARPAEVIVSPSTASTEKAAAEPASAGVTVGTPAAPASPESLHREVSDTVDAWSRAWSARDADAYLAFYAPAFAPARGQSREAWAAQRRQRLAAAGSISVGVRDLRVEHESADRVVVRYLQDYAADRLRETGTPKRLLMVREAAGWRIAAETEERAGRKAG